MGVDRIEKRNGFTPRMFRELGEAYSTGIGSKHIAVNATGGRRLTAGKPVRHGGASKNRNNAASNSTKLESCGYACYRQKISTISERSRARTPQFVRREAHGQVH